MAYHASERLHRVENQVGTPDRETGVGLKLFALFAGLALGAMVPFLIWLTHSAQSARNDASAAAAKVSALKASGSSTAAMPGMPARSTSSQGTYATPSFAGLSPATGDALAMAHEAVPAELPAAPAGPVAAVRLSITHRIVSIARVFVTTHGPSATPSRAP
jgi:predicted lipid-binding transport protein (Tim44 family)